MAGANVFTPKVRNREPNDEFDVYDDQGFPIDQGIDWTLPSGWDGSLPGALPSGFDFAAGLTIKPGWTSSGFSDQGGAEAAVIALGNRGTLLGAPAADPAGSAASVIDMSVKVPSATSSVELNAPSAGALDPAGDEAGGLATGLSPGNEPVPHAGSRMTINMIADDSVSGAPAGFTTAILQAADMIGRAFSDNITLNIRYGWGSKNNVAHPNEVNDTGAYASNPNWYDVAYSQVKTWLTGSASTSDHTTAYNSIPASNTSIFYVNYAQAKAFGYLSGTNADVTVQQNAIMSLRSRGPSSVPVTPS